MRYSRRLGLIVASVALLTPAAASEGVPTSPNVPVLRVFIPGLFAGCSTTSPGASEALKDVLSLVRPSAFTVNPVGRLVGAGGPVVSAELVSDEPQTVVVTVDPRYTWSNGMPFTVEDLIRRIQIGQSSTAAWADGFHRIASYKIGTTRKTLRIVFAEKYASWPNMFQGLEQITTTANCNLADVAQRPSLGPYLLESLNSTQAVLVANPQFRIRAQQFRTVIVTAGQAPSATVGRPIVDYRYSFSGMDVTWLASLPGRSGKIAPSQRIVAVTFSPRSNVTQDASVREALSLSIDRYGLINSVFGSISQSISPSTSAFLAQGQTGYSVMAGSAPFQAAASTTTTVPISGQRRGTHGFECVACGTDLSSSSVAFSNGVLLWQGAPITLRLASGPSEAAQKVAIQVAKTWQRIGVRTRIIPVNSDRSASQAVAGGVVDAAVTATPTGFIGSVATSWYGPRRRDTVDFGWRSPVCEAAAVSAERNFNATTALDSWAECDKEIASQYWQRPIVSLPYLLQWTNTVVGVTPSNTTRGFIDQIPLWSSLQRR